MPDFHGFVPRAVMSTAEYLETEETNRPRELTYGILRDAPGPSPSHQSHAFRLARILAEHVESFGLGQVLMSPVDVVLDPDLHLVVQPDILFISNARESIVRDRVWGAPDLVVEVLSPGTAAHDRGNKLAWYRRYGVREYWVVDRRAQSIEVHTFEADDGDPRRVVAVGGDAVVSVVLPELKITVSRIFG